MSRVVMGILPPAIPHFGYRPKTYRYNFGPRAQVTFTHRFELELGLRLAYGNLIATGALERRIVDCRFETRDRYTRITLMPAPARGELAIYFLDKNSAKTVTCVEATTGVD